MPFLSFLDFLPAAASRIALLRLRPRACFWIEVAARSRATAFRDSAVITLLNPKSIGFFIAFVPQFIDVSVPLGPQFTVMIATFVGLGGLNALAYALLASRLRGFVTRPRVHTWLQRGSGAVLIGLAALTATLRRA